MRRLVFLSFMLLYFAAKPQAQNVIQNGSFENYTAPVNCSGGSGGFDNYSVFPVNHVVDNWYGYYSTDFFTSICSGAFSNGVPLNLFGYSYPEHGNNYVGIGLYQKGNEIKEYIYQNLTSPLQPGKIYCLSFFIKRSQRSTYATKNIEVLFSNNSVNTGTLGYINAIPQITKQNIFITDTTNWIEVQGCFTANGGEQFMTIGNFNNNGNTDTLFIGTDNPISGYGDFSHYYIDDITLIDQSTVGINELDKENSFVIYPNPTNSILNIKSNNQQLQNATIEIKNTLGQLVYFDVYAPQINISDLPSGLYFITSNNKETKRTIKFVKD